MTKNIVPYFMMLPAIIIGSIAMIRNDLPLSIWIQNIMIWVLGCVLGYLFLSISKKRHSNKNPFDFIPIIISIILLTCPFFTSYSSGVHRWLSIGPIMIYPASIFLPLVIIYLDKTLANYPESYTLGLLVILLLILLFQPDAGQLTAFSCAISLLIFKKVDKPVLRYTSLVILLIFVGLTWLFIDNLAPVSYVENIFSLVKDMGPHWFVLGTISLILLVLPFFTLATYNWTYFSLGLYFLAEIVVPFFGNFPMPIMGYGISPIIGYLIAITYAINQSDRGTKDILSSAGNE
ncbi:FtsW/RodA/SpoVE family cell cycle protein [uncultured Vagococcus sp.]|uniref:FtsW/RodA/SpoVE family cell cycle protein n=1 Tax=uncultured Vagococcus sp. TaxID=189676 RepID=UPI0028D1DEE4|nr:FtsW/RodA/SpoVE family cell cycle protein [uncultured Vagococcus sp.]